MTESEVSLDESLKHVMRRFAQTVCVVSLRNDRGERIAMTASSATSVSLSPPSMLVCVNRGASPHDHMLTAGNRFCINVLSDDMRDVADLCAGQAEGESRFATGGWQADPASGTPQLPGALANVHCQTDATLPYGSHMICVGRVMSVSLRSEPGRPLVYADGRYTTLAG